MTTKVKEDIQAIWIEFKKDLTNQELRNQLMVHYFPLVKFNADRVWAKLPDGVDLNDLQINTCWKSMNLSCPT